MEKIKFRDPDRELDLEFFVLEQTRINGQNYLLVTEEEEADGLAYILQEVETGDAESVYEFVEDEMELDAISKVFTEMLEDVDIEL